MKMFKKLMAVVLTGALAASMLTGCALTNKLAKDAMIKQLNNATNSQQGDSFKGYENNSTMDSAANKVVSNTKSNKTGDAQKAALVELAKKNTLQAKETYTSGSKKYEYQYIVVKLPSDKTNSGKWTEIGNTLLNTSAFAKDTAYVKSSNKKVQVGMSDPFDAKVSDKTESYVVITVQTAEEK